MGKSHVVRRGMAVLGLVGITIAIVPGTAGAQVAGGLPQPTASVQKGQYSEMDPTPHATLALALATRYGDTEARTELVDVAQRIAADAAAGRPINPANDRAAIALAERIYGAYAERAVVDAAGGPTNYELAKTAARFNAPGDCSNDYDFVTRLQMKTKLISRVRDGKATVTLNLDKPLCQPVTYEMQSWSKVGSKPWPAPQVVYDVNVQTVQAAGSYSWEVDVPRAIGGAINLVCALQLDFVRQSSFGPEGTVMPTLLDFAQYDVATENTPENNSWNYFEAGICDTPDTTVGGTQVTTQVLPAQVTKTSGPSGSLPLTGTNTVPLILVAVGLIILGWVFLAGKSAMGALEHEGKK